MFTMKTMLAGVAILSSVHAASAADYQINMVNQGPDRAMQFVPQLLRIAPGDTVHFMPLDKGHNAESIPGMLPEGAKSFAGPIGGNLTVTLTAPGVYGYRCQPHGSLGMVGLIVVGNASNEEAAKSASVPGLAHQVFAKLFENLDSHRTASK